MVLTTEVTSLHVTFTISMLDLNIIETLCLGRLYDEDGNLSYWWENATEEEYILRANCIVHQYSNFFDKQAGLHIKGKQNLGENIADNGGVKVAYMAYCEYIHFTLRSD